MNAYGRGNHVWDKKSLAIALTILGVLAFVVVLALACSGCMSTSGQTAVFDWDAHAKFHLPEFVQVWLTNTPAVK